MYNKTVFIILGALNVLAFSPFNLWWVSIASLSLMLVLFDQYRGEGFKIGFLYGLGMFGAGVSWIFNSLYDYGEAPFIAAAVMVIVSTLVLSIFLALMMKLFDILQSNQTSTRVICFVSIWVLIEWIRSWILTGFPWLLLGHTLVDSPLKGVVSVFGTFGGSALIAFLSIAVFEMVNAKKQFIESWVLTISIVIAAAMLLSTIEWTDQVSDKPIKVAAVQANIPFEMKWDKSRRNDVYQAYVDLTKPYIDSDIIVWPETAIPTFYRVANQGFIPLYEKELMRNNAELISGVFTYEPGTERIFNSFVTLGGDRQFYSKKHLVPFGEYIPLRFIFNFFQTIVTIPMSDLYPGEGSSILTMNNIPVGVSICYEVTFGEEILHALPQAQLLVNVSNDAWFGDSLAPHQHLQIARVRALETGRYMVRATNTGVSALIDPQGRIVRQSGQFVEEVVSGHVWAMKGRTPFIIWGNWAIIIIMSGLLLLVFVQFRKSKTA